MSNMQDSSQEEERVSGLPKTKENETPWAESVKLWIMIINLIITLIVFARQCSTEKKWGDYEYLLSASADRPYLMIDSLSVSARLSVIDVITPDGRLTMQRGLNKYLEQIDVFPRVPELKMKFDLLNRGSSAGSVLVTLTSDSISWEPVLWNRFLSDVEHDSLVDSHYNPIANYILPGDRTQYDVRVPMSISQLKSHVIHVLLLFRNDANAVFATYTWIQFNIDDTRVSNAVAVEDSSGIRVIDATEFGMEKDTLSAYHPTRIVQTSVVLKPDELDKFWNIQNRYKNKQ